ncbi:membrane protease subunit HflC [Sagittula marina]|uniref:Membrane protease subunit HflC n=1 Tax=Sagittula marina TaxID=943940 RepID=A0A7W6DMY8_9RHOB|nr:protease modulator HflC [Sagittula marina]MBB3984461.1 membrane protease subunit HflC [Sagittula marina]
MNKTTYILPAIVVILVVLLSSIFVVDEREKALVMRFGQIQSVKEEPGLGFKMPLLDEVVTYDDRILSLDTETIEVTPSDDRRLVVDAFARYRIQDVVQFRQAVGVGGVRVAEDRLQGILNAQIREVLGADQVTSDTILSEDRGNLMIRIRDQARGEARSLGLDVVDVRLKQTNLPTQNLEATFARMRAEREREAADEIARGNEAAQRVRALADRTVVETLSEADREANVTRGEADAERNAIFADSYGADPDFFAFYRSLQAYETAIQGGNSTMVMTPNSQFFDYFKSEGEITPTSPIETPETLQNVEPAADPVAPTAEDVSRDMEAEEQEANDAVDGPATDTSPVGEPVEDTGSTQTDAPAEPETSEESN